MKLNPDTLKVEKVRKALSVNNGFCPCVLTKSEDTLCPCKKMRENSECVCGLYINE